MKPLLVKIKNAYDKALSEAQMEACETGPLRSLVATVAEDCERKILQIKQAEKVEMNRLKAGIAKSKVSLTNWESSERLYSSPL